MPQVLYFLSDADGRWELSDGDRKLGHVEQAGLGFGYIQHLILC